MKDIELEDAVIAVFVGQQHETGGEPRAINVFRRLDPEANRYDMTLGACEARWHRHPDHRLGFLYEILWTLVLGFGFQPEAINEVLQAIPEYRALNPPNKPATPIR
ncbi:hypothetical protein [Sandarakinorhabdus oryzae]|uniref:hypothetical protein n=1 Tax=Sandarakinorhabdus oryzae TaxID=2675220 RepID=UPI0012E0D260|nr:hypothetical protein [Sandarakinorhabdus oryzae]